MERESLSLFAFELQKFQAHKRVKTDKVDNHL